MAEKSAIEWTDTTWNPVTGCTKISAGCDNCYAARFSERFRNVPGHPFETGFDLTLRPERLAQPLYWKRPRMIFVNSISDLFQKFLNDRYRNSAAPSHMWFGVSVENEKATSRIVHLQNSRAKVRFLSIE